MCGQDIGWGKGLHSTASDAGFVWWCEKNYEGWLQGAVAACSHHHKQSCADTNAAAAAAAAAADRAGAGMASAATTTQDLSALFMQVSTSAYGLQKTKTGPYCFIVQQLQMLLPWCRVYLLATPF
jgi:hypothetical protein